MDITNPRRADPAKVTDDPRPCKPAASRRPSGRPRQFSMGDVMAAVQAIGLDNLKLQGVADALDVTPAALYRHVSSKEDLVDRFVAYITAEFPVIAVPGEDWPTWAVRFAAALLELYRAVPGLADYSIRQTQTSEAVLSRHETSLAAASISGLGEVAGLYATRAVVEFVAGWAAREQRRDQLARRRGSHPDHDFQAFLLSDHGRRYPLLASAVRAEAHQPEDARFHATLGALIAGFTSGAARAPSGARPV